MQGLHVDAAKRFLESEEGGRRIQEVCGAVGYDDAMFFRELFKRHTGLSPNAYRQRFGREA